MGAANNPPTDKESFARDAMHRWVRHQQRTDVLHLTDLDPNGWGISKALEKDLEAFIETNGWFDGFNPLEYERVGLEANDEIGNLKELGASCCVKTHDVPIASPDVLVDWLN